MPYSQLLKGRYSQPGQVYLVTTRLARGAPLLELATGRLVGTSCVPCTVTGSRTPWPSW